MENVDSDIQKRVDEIQQEMMEEQPQVNQEDLERFVEELGLGQSSQEIKQGTPLDNENMKQTVEYALGKTERPEYLEKFLADIESRLKDLSLASCALQLAEIPKLMVYKQMLDESLFTQESIDEMSESTKINLSNSLRREMSAINEGTFKILQNVGNIGAVDSKYRDLLNRLMTASPEVIQRVSEILKREQEY